MKTTLALLLTSALLLHSVSSHAAVNSKEQVFTQALSAGAVNVTTTFSPLDAGFLSVVTVRFTSAPASAETITVYRDSRMGATFDTVIAKYVTVAGSTTDVTFMFGNQLPIAETDQVRITCTANTAVATVTASVLLDVSPRSGMGLTVFDNGVQKMSSLHHDYHWHFGDIVPDANQSFGAYYSDFAAIAAPSDPAAGTRRLFVDTATDELSVRTSAGTTVSLETSSGGSAHEIQDEGTPLPAQAALNFIGLGVDCVDGAGSTDCTIGGGSGGGNSVEATASFSDSGEGSVETVVTGLGWVLSTSTIVCTATGFSTADRADGDEDALIEGIQAIAHTRVVATGFTIETKARYGNAHGDYIVHCVAV